MSKANNEVYGTSYIPPNQLGDSYGLAQQVVFQGISTLSTFQFVQSGDYLQMYAVSPTLPPLFTTETYLPAYTSIAQVIGRTQHMGINDSNSVMPSDLDMTNNNILNVNEIDAQEVVCQDINLDGHHLTTDSNGNILIDGQPSDANWYQTAVPIGSNIKFLSASPSYLVNTLYTPNGADLFYNNINLTAGGGGGGSAENWATYPANSNVQIPYPYQLNVGTNAPTATFATINLCGNTTIGRQSLLPLDAPNVSIYPYEFSVGDVLHPAFSISMDSGLGGTTIASLEGISLDATIDVNINAGGVLALDAGADMNLLALGELSVESLNTTIATGALQVGATTSIINTTPLFEITGATTNITSGATTIGSDTTAITSGSISLTGATSISLTSPYNSFLGAVNTFSGGNVNLYPTIALNMGQISVPTNIAGSQIDIVSANPINVLAPVNIVGNRTLKTGVITDVAGSLNIRSANATTDVVVLSNVASINSVNGTALTNIKSIASSAPAGSTQANIASIALQSPTASQITNISSITNSGYMTIQALTETTLRGNITQVFGTAELDLVSGTLVAGSAPTISMTGSTQVNLNAPTINIDGASQVNINAPIVNMPNASYNTSIINCSTINTSTITTNGSVAITNGGLSATGNITTPANMGANIFVGVNNVIFPIQTIMPTFPNNIVPTYVGGSYPCYRYSIPITGLPAGHTYLLSISAQVQIANAGFPAFYGAGYGTTILNTSASSKWYYRAIYPTGSTFPFIIDDDQNIVGDLVGQFLAPITANSPSYGTTYGEGITLQFNYTYTITNKSAITITWDLYGFSLVSPYTLNNLLLTTDIEASIIS